MDYTPKELAEMTNKIISESHIPYETQKAFRDYMEGVAKEILRLRHKEEMK